MGNTHLKRKIEFVADGEVSRTSTEAVNGSQLFALINAKDTQGFSINTDEWRKKLGIDYSVTGDSDHHESINGADVHFLRPIETRSPNESAGHNSSWLSIEGDNETTTVIATHNADASESIVYKYLVKALAKGTISENETRAVSGDTVYKYLGEHIVNRDGSNIDVSAWKKKLGLNTNALLDTTYNSSPDNYYDKSAVDGKFGGEVIEGNTKAVSGDTVHKHLAENYYDKSAVDTKIKSIVDTIPSLDGEIITTETQKGVTGAKIANHLNKNYYDKAMIDSKLKEIQLSAGSLPLGEVSENEDRAVSGHKIYEYVKSQTKNFQEQLTQQAKSLARTQSGVASAIAMASIPYNLGNGNNHHVGVGLGYHYGHLSTAIGYTFVSDNKKYSFRGNVGVHTNGADLGVGAGLSW